MDVNQIINHMHTGKLFDNVTFLKHSLTYTTRNRNTLLFLKENKEKRRI